MKFRKIEIFIFLFLLIGGLTYFIFSGRDQNNYIYISNNQDDFSKEISNKFLYKKDFDEIFKYFLMGFLRYSTDDHALVNYPGIESYNGNKINQIEGVARTLPLFAAWVYSGRDSIVHLNNNSKINLISLIKSSILSGTDPLSVNYWGEINDYSQKVLEASDIAKVLWLTKVHIWNKLTPDEKVQIVNWLLKATNVKVVENNWLLAPFIIELFLQDVGYLKNVDTNNYYKFMKYYQEMGWFKDGEFGEVDYYNTWGITYDLFWINKLDPKFDNIFIRNVLSQSSYLTSHLISKNGIPYMGRSMCYRTAIPSPIIINSLITRNEEGVAKRALDYTWTYFVRNKLLNSGTVTLGYFNNDFRFVNDYTGSGSCHWGLRSLVVSYMFSPDSNFWKSPGEKLPVEISDYSINLPKIGWKIIGNKKTGVIKLYIEKNRGNSVKIEKDDTNLRFYINKILNKPYRSGNHEILYKKYIYSSNEPLTSIK